MFSPAFASTVITVAPLFMPSTRKILDVSTPADSSVLRRNSAFSSLPTAPNICTFAPIFAAETA
ncbi:Uncharacterised protein [Chlamydia trachomatis]|nr:Uncharacterised protein [Chlamydia trachomatis]